MERRKALVVGIDNYPGQELDAAVSDARAVAKLLARHDDGDPNFYVKLYTAPVPKPDGTMAVPEDSDVEEECADKNGIPQKFLRDKIDELFQGDNDIALFYFSGHGALTSVGGTVITSDTKIAAEALPMDEILDLANNSKAREKVIILDCCHSGAFGSPNTADGKVREISQGMVVFSAALPSQKAMERKSIGHGTFTELLIEALNGAAADLLGEITPGAIYHYVDEALGTWEQRPVFKTNVTGWSFLRKVTGPDSSALPRGMVRKIKKYFADPEHELPLSPEYEPSDPSHDPDKVAIFQDLRTFAGVDLVVPVGEDHMYWAAMRSKSCKLTPLGKRYWRLVKDNRV